MPTQGVSAPYDTGTHYGLNSRFGHFRVAPLLHAIAHTLEPGSVVTFVNPVDRRVKMFLKQHGRKVRRFLWQHDYEVVVGGTPDLLAQLVELVSEWSVDGLAVWFLAYGPSGRLLLECEDCNDYLWLSDALPLEVKRRLVDSVGGSKQVIEGSPPTC